MLPLESTTRQVGAGVSGTLKSAETRRMLLPFSTVWIAVPVLALGPWNMDVVCGPLSDASAIAVVASNAATAKVSEERVMVFISLFSLSFFVCLLLLLRDLDGMPVWIP